MTRFDDTASPATPEDDGSGKWVWHRIINTPQEADRLADRAAFLTPGGIIFRKFNDYFATGKDGWERELGQVVETPYLMEDHFPGLVLVEGDNS